MSIKLKKVSKGDWDLIRILRNENYEFFYKQKSPITETEHFEYMEKQKSNPKFHHWFVFSGENIVGYVRILDSDVGIIIKKEFQNQGFATEALKLAEIEAKKLGLTKLVALVMQNNNSSEQLFKRCDYKLKIHWYEKEIS